ncbi:MAG: hypothetical protein V2I65_11670 [Paracoccaceae bacterium]|jgi:hypothetical protein|nr:hypothetical protein [Paracoccaceae bacterium]
MPLDRFVLILVIALAGAGVTVLLGALALSAGHLPGLGLAVAVPLALLAYLLVRVIADRARDGEGGRYDRPLH